MTQEDIEEIKDWLFPHNYYIFRELADSND